MSVAYSKSCEFDYMVNNTSGHPTVTSIIKQTPLPPSMPAAMINPAVALAMAGVGRTGPEVGNLPIKQRLGLPVSKPARIAALSRRDPRLWRHEDKNVGVLHPVEVKPAVVSRKRPSSEILVGKAKKNKHDNFDVLFGNEEVDLRQVPQVKEINVPPPPSMNDSTKVPRNLKEVKEKNANSKKTSLKLDIAKATLAEATKGNDRLERSLPLSKSPSMDMLASVMTPPLTPISASEYSLAELFSKPDKIPGLDILSEENNNVIHKIDSSRSETLKYHPLSFEDYKASLTKEEPLHMSTDNDTVVEKIEEPIEICDDDDIMSQSVNKSVEEVVELEEKEVPESVEILEDNVVQVEDLDDSDEDDVVFIAEPIVQVDVRDDDDTDDETNEERRRRDEQVKIDFANVRVKIEPVDPDDEPIIIAEETLPTTTIDITPPSNNLASVTCSIDGNVQLDPTPVLASSLPPGGIRINISKVMPSFVNNVQEDKMLEDISMDDDSPPGEEPELEYKLKPMLEDVHFSRQPPVQKGNELSGLCSIM
ncbi:uncharacterized protein ACR2FA_007641 [Aphomia sociella]